MQRYSDDVINQAGRPQAGVTVTVTVANASCGSGALASLFSDDGITVTGNPQFTDAFGRYGFYVPTGKYDLTFSGGAVVTFCRSAVEIGDFLEFKSGDLAPTSTGNWLATGNWTFSGVNTHSGAETFTAASNLNAGGALVGTFTGNPTLSGNPVFSGAPSFTGTGNTGTLGLGATALAANNAFTGANTHTGSESFKSLNNIQFCDQFAGADASAKIQACITALPASGGVADARNLSDSGGTGSTVIDPGSSKAVVLLLGPYTYQIQQILVRPSFKVHGSGRATILQSVSTTLDVIALGAQGTGITDVSLRDFTVQCGSGNTTQIGMHFVVPVGGVGGLWNSRFDTITIGPTNATACGGGSMLFDGNNGGGSGLNQFLTFNDITAFRQSGQTAPAFRATGLNGQFTFNRVQFDGPTPKDTVASVNFQIDDGTQTFRSPYTFYVEDGTFQQGFGTTAVGIRLAGVEDFTCMSCHFENLNGGIKATVGTTFGSWGTTIIASNFDTTTGINSGNGFILSMDTSSSVAFIHNTIANTPDTMFAGNTKFLEYLPSINTGNGTLQPQPAQLPAPFQSGGPAAVLSGTGACATLTTQKGGSWSGQVTCTGTTGASTLVIAPGTTAANGYSCHASDLTTANALRQSASGPTNCTIAGTVNANDVLTFDVVAY